MLKLEPTNWIPPGRFIMGWSFFMGIYLRKRLAAGLITQEQYDHAKETIEKGFER